jgi:SAM-dependent methyltransferase
MSSFGDQYVLSSGRTGQDRLRMLCEIHDPQTRELLKRAGLTASHRYVEFGCGLGYVARWAARQASWVTAVDLSDEHLKEAQRLAESDGLTNIDFLNRNIYDHDLPRDAFDISYSRWVLMHLKQPVEAMRQIRNALKPGGIMVCEEADLSAVYTEPRTFGYEEYRTLALETGRQRGVDYEGGRRLHTWAHEAGFEIVDVAAYHPHYLTGRHKGFWSWTFEEAGRSLLEAGLIGADELGRLLAGMRLADQKASVLVAHARNHQLIARRPV